MPFINPSAIVDAARFESIAHATVMPSGRLRFANDAVDMMNLAGARSVLLFECQEQRDDPSLVEFGMVASNEEDPRGFTLKSSGPYKYISLKDYFLSRGIDFKNYSISYEVTRLDETFDGRPAFRLTQYKVPRIQTPMAEAASRRGMLAQLGGNAPRTMTDDEIIAEKDRITRQEIEAAKTAHGDSVQAGDDN